MIYPRGNKWRVHNKAILYNTKEEAEAAEGITSSCECEDCKCDPCECSDEETLEAAAEASFTWKSADET
jgi:hypothetical protein